MKNLITTARDGLKQAEEAAWAAKMAGLQGARELERILALVEIVQNRFWTKQLELKLYDKRRRHAHQAPIIIDPTGYVEARLSKHASDDSITGAHFARRCRKRYHSESDVNAVPYILNRYKDITKVDLYDE